MRPGLGAHTNRAMETSRPGLWVSPGGPGRRQPDLGEPQPTEQVHPCVQPHSPPAKPRRKQQVLAGTALGSQRGRSTGLGSRRPEAGPACAATCLCPCARTFHPWSSAQCLWLNGERQGTSKGLPISDHLSSPHPQFIPRIVLRALGPLAQSLSLGRASGARASPCGLWLFHLPAPPGLSLSSWKTGLSHPASKRTCEGAGCWLSSTCPPEIVCPGNPPTGCSLTLSCSLLLAGSGQWEVLARDGQVGKREWAGAFSPGGLQSPLQSHRSPRSLLFPL